MVVGFDPHFNYHKLCHANYYLREAKDQILFVATNTDPSYVTKNGRYPGTGSLVSAVSTACQREPVVVGKPESVFMECIKSM